MISAVSFYLKNPKSSTLTPLYVSVSGRIGSERERFNTGHSLDPKYCNLRQGKKGGKDLIKKNTSFTMEYDALLQKIYVDLLKIQSDLTQTPGAICTVADIRKKYEERYGKSKAPAVTFESVWQEFKKEDGRGWSLGFAKVMSGAYNHFEAFNKEDLSFPVERIDENMWREYSEYLTEDVGLTNPTANKQLKRLKQFLRFCAKKKYFSRVNELDFWPQLKTVKTFRIALKEHEIEAFIKLSLPLHGPHDKARDLLLLEVFTGQRYSDMNAVLDRKNYDGDFIRIYQQKTGELVSIPRHYQLENHLSNILSKYPDGFPVMSNQKFNDYLKEIAHDAGLTQVHQWTTISGAKKTVHTAARCELVTSHVGRRTFATIARKKNIPIELIMKVTGHKSIKQFQEYVTIDDDDVKDVFKEKFNQQTVAIR